jgi:hypothetical protein
MRRNSADFQTTEISITAFRGSSGSDVWSRRPQVVQGRHNNLREH